VKRALRLAAAALLAAPLAGAPSRLAAQGWLERTGLDRLASLRRPVTVWGELAVSEHRVTLGAETEQATGPVLGLGARGAVTSWLDLRLTVRGGTLDADWAPSESRRMGEIALAAEAFPLSWVGVVGAASTRGYRTGFGRQRWTRLTIGPEVRTPLLGEHVFGHVRLAAMPYVDVSDTRAPSRALEGVASVRYENGRLHGSLAYALERYDFDAVAGGRRLEQLSGLTLALGWRLGD
jgi:hypothetical protein